MSETRSVDESFLALPLSALTEAALTRARDLGCEHADLRVERIRTQSISLRDARLERRRGHTAVRLRSAVVRTARGPAGRHRAWLENAPSTSPSSRSRCPLSLMRR